MSASGRQWGQGIAAGLMLVAGCVFLYFFALAPLLERRAVLVHSVPVQATIEVAGPDALRSYVVHSGDGAARMYEPQVRFRYSVDGQEFRADTYSCAQTPMLKDDAAAISSAYAPDQVVSAWYPQGAPGQAYLVKAYVPWMHVALMMLGPIILICGGIMLTTLVPISAIDDPDPRVQAGVGLMGSAVSGGVLAHYFTQSGTPMPALMLLAAGFLLGLPLLALVWGVWTLITGR